MASVIASKPNTSLFAKESMHIAKEKIDLVDFKMVTFSLAGKDYGIDIMKVKEIARFVNFTYVPNTPNFVRGVYNLRGDIISIIDLRAMFNLPYKQKAANEEEAGLIIRLDNNLIGVVVDKIDKVVGISSSSIQPPHPIFGDINIKFISGVVENDGRLYIILDVEKVLGKAEDRNDRAEASVKRGDLPHRKGASEVEVDPRASIGAGEASVQDQNRVFVKEALEALLGFVVNDINQTWFNRAFEHWESQRKGNQVQIKSADEARIFMDSYYSPQTGMLWAEDYLQAFMAVLPPQAPSQINVWNPGCGRGYETYSMAVALRKKYPESRIKIWASDKDLLSISNAPNLTFADREIPEVYAEFMVEGKNGKSFSQKIKEMILFEYHDMVNEHSVPPLDLVLSRDVLPFLGRDAQAKVLVALDDMVKPGGLVILGGNEVIPAGQNWRIAQHDGIQVGHRI